MHIVILVMLLISIINVYPLANAVGSIFENYSSITSTLIYIKPNADHYASIYPLFSPETGFNMKLDLKKLFNETDYNRVKNIGHVEKVIKSLTFQVSLHPDTEVWREKEKLESGGLEGPRHIYLKIFLVCVEANKTEGVISYFNNLVEGRFVEPGTNEIVISSDLSGETGLKVGDEVKIPFGLMIGYENASSLEEVKSLTFVRFKIVGLINAPKRWGDAAADLGFMMKIFRETNMEKLQPYIANGSFPVYTGFYVKVDSPDYLFDVEQSIKEMYPHVGVEYPAALASLSKEVLAGVKRSYDVLILFMIVPTAVILFSVRVLEGLRSRRQIGLLKAIGWRNKHVLIFILVETVVVGVLGGFFASIVSLLLAPFLRKVFLVGGYFGEDVVRADVKTLLYSVVSRIPDKTLLVYSPILGILIFLLASLFTTVYYIRLSPAETLKEV